MNGLLDERASPPLRQVLGGLLARCEAADIAVGNIRLAVIDLTEAEVARVRRCRILLGRLDARSLGMQAVDDALRRNATALLHFIGSGRVEIRNAGLASWAPDFSVFRELDGDPSARVCLIGAHYFRDPVASRGPSLTACIDDTAAIDVVCRRFEELWNASYDVSDAVRAALLACSGIETAGDVPR